MAFFALALLALSSLLWYLYTKGLLFTTLLASTSSKSGGYDLGAASLLEQHSATVTEIAYMVGFQNPAHFATSFKKEYRVSPSKYSSRQ